MDAFFEVLFKFKVSRYLGFLTSGGGFLVPHIKTKNKFL